MTSDHSTATGGEEGTVLHMVIRLTKTAGIPGIKVVITKSTAVAERPRDASWH